MKNLYILIGRDPVPICMGQTVEWATWMHRTIKHVATTEVSPRKPLKGGHPSVRHRLNKRRAEPVFVSTVFLGLNHRFWGKGAPLVFETMIFGGLFDGYQRRYCTWNEAEEGHRKALALLNLSTEG